MPNLNLSLTNWVISKMCTASSSQVDPLCLSCRGWGFFVLLGCFWTTSFLVSAQSAHNLSGLLRSYPQANIVHPAYVPSRARLVVGIPALSTFSAGVRNRFSYADAFNAQNNKSVLDVGRLYRETLARNNFFSAQLSNNLLYAGYREPTLRTYFSFYANERVDAFLGYSKDFVDLLWNGNSSLVGTNGRTFSGIPLDLLHFREYALSTAVETNGPLVLGLGLKFLQGLSHLGLRPGASFNVSVEESTYHHALDLTELQLRTSGIFAALMGVEDGDVVSNSGGINLSQGLMGGRNMGLGVDLGAFYSIWPIDLNLSLSLKDLGFIHWRDRIKYYEFGTSLINYEGMGALEGDDLGEKFEESLDFLSFEEERGEDSENPSYRTLLPTSLLFTADWAPANTTGLLFTSLQTERRGAYYFFSPVLGYTYTFFSELHLSGISSLPALNAPVLGLAVAYSPGPFYLHLSATGLPDATLLRAFTFSFGMALAFSDPEEEDTDYIEPPESRKRYRFFPRRPASE